MHVYTCAYVSFFEHKRKIEMAFLNVAFNADDWFAHDVPQSIRHFAGWMDKLHLGFAFALRVNHQIAVIEYSAANGLVY